MTTGQGAPGATGGLRGMRRKAVTTAKLVETGFLPGIGVGMVTATAIVADEHGL